MVVEDGDAGRAPGVLTVPSPSQRAVVVNVCSRMAVPYRQRPTSPKPQGMLCDFALLRFPRQEWECGVTSSSFGTHEQLSGEFYYKNASFYTVSLLNVVFFNLYPKLQCDIKDRY